MATTETIDHEHFISNSVSNHKRQWLLWCAMIYSPQKTYLGNKDECGIDSVVKKFKLRTFYMKCYIQKTNINFGLEYFLICMEVVSDKIF